MMKQLLIVRSVSFQQIDLDLPEIRKAFPEYAISIITHKHGYKLAEKYKDIQRIYVYDYKHGFVFYKKAKELKDKNFDVVIIPVSNTTGAGFLNVLLFGFSIKAEQRYVCNLVSDIKKVSAFHIALTVISTFIYKLLAFVLTCVCCMLLVLFLPCRYLARKS